MRARNGLAEFTYDNSDAPYDFERVFGGLNNTKEHVVFYDFGDRRAEKKSLDIRVMSLPERRYENEQQGITPMMHNPELAGPDALMSLLLPDLFECFDIALHADWALGERRFPRYCCLVDMFQMVPRCKRAPPPDRRTSSATSRPDGGITIRIPPAVAHWHSTSERPQLGSVEPPATTSPTSRK